MGAKIGKEVLDEALAEFLSGASEHFDRIEQGLIGLENDPGRAETIDSIFRHMHSLKGDSNLVGRDDINGLAHACENLLSRIRSGEERLTPERIELLLQTNDFMRKLVGPERDRGDSREIEKLLGMLMAESKNGPERAGKSATPDPGSGAENAAPETESDGNAGVGRYLTFFLRNERYAVDVLKVVEIVSPPPITRVPHTRRYLSGMINLRGMVLPVVDLGLRLGTAPVEMSELACVVVLAAGEARVGLLIDAIEEVMDIPVMEIESVPAASGSDAGELVAGVARTRKGLGVILAVERIVLDDDMVRPEFAKTGGCGT